MSRPRPAIEGCRTAARLALRVLAIAGLTVTLAGCYKTRDRQDVTGSIQNDHRQRHPITIGEGTRTLEIHIGSGRGGLTPTQRAEVLAFAHTWRREATGGVTIDRPTGGPADRATLDSLKQVLSILTSAGIPNHGIGIKPYRAATQIAVIRLNYPQVVAKVGPCGTWPDDLGPSYNVRHYENRQYHNLGCATQRNLAAMVDNKADLVQPRAETPAYTAKRTFGMDKWRRGESPATQYPDNSRATVSDVGR